MIRRATPLPPDARRANIAKATLPLLRTHGRSLTTAQIATAAGVAEGTLFRSFPDKDAIIEAALAIAFDPAPVEQELSAIDARIPLRESLERAIEILRRRIEGIWELISILGRTPPMSAERPHPASMNASNDYVQYALSSLFAAHAHEIHCTPEHAARVLRMMAFAGTHPRITDGQPLAATEIVSILLDGIRARKEGT